MLIVQSKLNNYNLFTTLLPFFNECFLTQCSFIKDFYVIQVSDSITGFPYTQKQPILMLHVFVKISFFKRVPIPSYAFTKMMSIRDRVQGRAVPLCSLRFNYAVLQRRNCSFSDDYNKLNDPIVRIFVKNRSLFFNDRG